MSKPLEPRIKPPRMTYCSRCCYPLVAATPITLDKEMVCSGCRTREEQKTVNWGTARAECPANYATIIARARGKLTIA